MSLSVAKPVFSVIIPTVGRATLRSTLRRLRSETRGDVEAIVVSDGDFPDAKRTVESEGARFITGPETRHWGNAQRMMGISEARGRYLLFIDDDDVHRRGAFARIRGAVAQNPDRIFIFRMVRHGEVLWRYPSVQEANQGTPQLLIPNVPGRVGSWLTNDRYQSDFDFLCECIGLQGDPLFNPAVIALAPPWHREWRDRDVMKRRLERIRSRASWPRRRSSPLHG
jgi:glycosyltransferase involved in cell wall biosynthesis